MRQKDLEDLRQRLTKASGRGVGIHIPGTVLTYPALDMAQVVNEALMFRKLKASLNGQQLAVLLELD